MAGFGTKCSFNTTSMWERLRGKRMMFVGDSLNRNQFASLICLLHSVIPESAKSMQTVNSIIVFRAEVIWNELLLDAFLVLSRNDVSLHQNGQHIHVVLHPMFQILYVKSLRPSFHYASLPFSRRIASCLSGVGLKFSYDLHMNVRWL